MKRSVGTHVLARVLRRGATDVEGCAYRIHISQRSVERPAEFYARAIGNTTVVLVLRHGDHVFHARGHERSPNIFALARV